MTVWDREPSARTARIRSRYGPGESRSVRNVAGSENRRVPGPASTVLTAIVLTLVGGRLPDPRRVKSGQVLLARGPRAMRRWSVKVTRAAPESS